MDEFSLAHVLLSTSKKVKVPQARPKDSACVVFRTGGSGQLSVALNIIHVFLVAHKDGIIPKAESTRVGVVLVVRTFRGKMQEQVSVSNVRNSCQEGF